MKRNVDEHRPSSTSPRVTSTASGGRRWSASRSRGVRADPRGGALLHHSSPRTSGEWRPRHMIVGGWTTNIPHDDRIAATRSWMVTGGADRKHARALHPERGMATSSRSEVATRSWRQRRGRCKNSCGEPLSPALPLGRRYREDPSAGRAETPDQGGMRRRDERLPPVGHRQRVGRFGGGFDAARFDQTGYGRGRSMGWHRRTMRALLVGLQGVTKSSEDPGARRHRGRRKTWM